MSHILLFAEFKSTGAESKTTVCLNIIKYDILLSII